MPAKKSFYCLIDGSDKTRNSSGFKMLKAACKKRNIPFEVLTAPEGAYSLKEVPVLGEGGIYRHTAGNKRLSQYGYALLQKNPQLKTWYIPKKVVASGTAWQSVMDGEKENLPMIPTLYGLTKESSQATLDLIDDYLGGFPVVIKKTGASHGAGVLLAESAPALKAMAGFIIDNKSNEYVLRQYLTNARNFRLIVLEDEVLASTEYKMPANDFRTNATSDPEVLVINPGAEIKKIAINATRNTGVVFGGVDILIDESGKPYIAEVNTPCNFSRSQKYTGEDIAGKLVEYFAV